MPDRRQTDRREGGNSKKLIIPFQTFISIVITFTVVFVIAIISCKMFYDKGYDEGYTCGYDKCFADIYHDDSGEFVTSIDIENTEY